MAVEQLATQNWGLGRNQPCSHLNLGLSASRVLRKFLSICPIYGTFYGSPEDGEVAWSCQEVRDSEGTVTTLHTTQPHQWVQLPRALLRMAKVVCLIPRYLDRYLLEEVKRIKCGGVYAVAWASPQEPDCVLQDKTGSNSGGL